MKEKHLFKEQVNIKVGPGNIIYYYIHYAAASNNKRFCVTNKFIKQVNMK